MYECVRQVKIPFHRLYQNLFSDILKRLIAHLARIQKYDFIDKLAIINGILLILFHRIDYYFADDFCLWHIIINDFRLFEIWYKHICLQMLKRRV